MADAPEDPAGEDAQLGLFGDGSAPPAGTPPEALEPIQSIYVHFESVDDVRAFAALIKQPVTTQTRWICFPPVDLRTLSSYVPPPAATEEGEDDEGVDPSIVMEDSQ